MATGQSQRRDLPYRIRQKNISINSRQSLKRQACGQLHVGRSRANHIRFSLCAFRKNERGATAIEYGLIASLIAVVIIGAGSVIGNDLTNTFSEVGTNLN